MRAQKTTCQIQDPDTPQAARVGAAHGGAAGQGWVERDTVWLIQPGDNPAYCPPAHLFERTKYMIRSPNRRMNKTNV